LVEQTIRNRQVKGSNPFGGSKNIMQKMISTTTTMTMTLPRRAPASCRW
jgi:hypothetical protein